MVDGLIIEILSRDNVLYNLFHEVCRDLLIGHSLIVLCRDQNGVHTQRHHSAALVLVLDGHLSLAVRSHPGAHSCFAHNGQAMTDLGSENVSERHQLLSLIRRVAEHVSLITGSDLLWLLCAHAMHSLADIRGLLLNVHKDLARVAVESDLSRREPNFFSSLANNRLVINLGLGRDLAEDHDHTSLRCGLASHLRLGVLFKARIQNCI
mmetsp:Transcript_22743/g.43489  ORF Transcript_22743/g.43489 Transcript_22743/m.43489 type:complete len:208 (-) Transcript_22743:152-775(-)